MKQHTHLFLTLTLVLGMLAAGAHAPSAQAMDAPIVREIYTCSFNEGKDMNDLMAARDFYLKQMEKAGQDPGTRHACAGDAQCLAPRPQSRDR